MIHKIYSFVDEDQQIAREFNTETGVVRAVSTILTAPWLRKPSFPFSGGEIQPPETLSSVDQEQRIVACVVATSVAELVRGRGILLF